MRRLLVVWLLLGLAGCVPAPQTFQSPLHLPATTQHYLPLVQGAGGKIGVGMDLAYRDCAYPARVGATWYYDWSPQPLQCPDLEAIPMLYSPDDGQSNPPTASPYLLVGNECDRPDQCNTSPESAAVWWRQVEQTYPERKLVGPNTSRAGMDWLLAWHAAYVRLYGETPRIWALGIHCYNPSAWCQDWTLANIALARQWTESGQVWVTEWATAGCYYSEARPVTIEAAVDDAAALQAWFAANPGVARIAWFIARWDGQRCASALIGPDGALTAYGVWHRSLAQDGVP